MPAKDFAIAFGRGETFFRVGVQLPEARAFFVHIGGLALLRKSSLTRGQDLKVVDKRVFKSLALRNDRERGWLGRRRRALRVGAGGRGGGAGEGGGGERGEEEF